MVREERRVLFPSTVCQGTRTRPRLGEVAENQQPFFDTHGGFFGSYISTKKSLQCVRWEHLLLASVSWEGQRVKRKSPAEATGRRLLYMRCFGKRHLCDQQQVKFQELAKAR